ncbi:hypothetical protein ACRAWC_22810 [Leifsonia sp. L25]|uniref:hypothetical protein n=1 Tax=Leifsonia sp. L25 TaxID=3423957 RepID=UPI003D698148
MREAAEAVRRAVGRAVAAIAAAVLASASGCSSASGGGATPPPAAATATTAPAPNAGWTLPSGPRVVFRNTRAGDGFGKVASVPLNSPGGERRVSPVACERVYATRAALSCMSRTSTDPVGYSETLHDGDGTEGPRWSLPGAPSRTRLSADSKLAAWTAFVDGESYANVKFATQTVLTDVHGTYYGPLDAFTFLLDAKPYSAQDLNFWGVTFAHDDNTFYADRSGRVGVAWKSKTT